MRAFRSASDFSSSGNFGGSPVSRPIVFLAKSQAICTCRVSGNTSGNPSENGLRARTHNGIALDLSIRQLTHARRLLRETSGRVALVNANAERTPFADSEFDIVFCDHGAMTFADPEKTVPEVARLLRPDGVFAFNIASPLIWLCWGDGEEPPGPELVRSYFGMRRETWETVEFQLPYGEWIRLFRANGFEIVDLIELRPPARPRTTYPDFAPLSWARRWPGENIWKLRKLG